MVAQPIYIEEEESPAGTDPRPFQRVVAGIIDRIVTGELRDGEEIPPVEQLAGASPSVDGAVARALGLAETLGFVETSAEGTALVRAERIHELGRSLHLPRPVDGPVAARLMVTLLYVEPPLAALAASNATEQDVIDLRDCLRRSAYVAETAPAECASQDARFHALVGRASQNLAFAQLSAAIRDFLTQPQSSLHVVASRDVHGIRDQHNRIYQAIKEMDTRASYEAMQSHVTYWMGCNVDLVGELYQWGTKAGRARTGHGGARPHLTGDGGARGPLRRSRAR